MGSDTNRADRSRDKAENIMIFKWVNLKMKDTLSLVTLIQTLDNIHFFA